MNRQPGMTARMSLLRTHAIRGGLKMPWAERPLLKASDGKRSLDRAQETLGSRSLMFHKGLVKYEGLYE
jgi:hypothetical protein